MRSLLSICLFFLLHLGLAHATDLENNQVVDALTEENTEELKADFNLKTFNSCENMEDVMGDYFKDSWKNNQMMYRGGFGFPVMMEMSVDDGVMADSAEDTSSLAKSTSSTESSTASESQDFSQTNTQVSGVDESDIVKTDGKRNYYYNATQKAVYIIEDLEVSKKINLPKSFYGAELYIYDDTLVIISTGYSQVNYSERGYFINRNTKTYTMVFDVKDTSKPKLEKLHVTDGSYSKSRRIGDYVYVLTNNYMNIPYYSYKSEDDIDINAEKLIPKQIELTLTDDESEQNLQLKGRDLPYRLTGGRVANCNEIEYVLPDEETIKKYSFNPSYNVITAINVSDTTENVQTKVVAGSNNEIYMSTENLYMTSRIYTSYDFTCPDWGACFMPYYYRGENTLVHKLNIDQSTLNYDTSTIIPGNPLTQYSMDEKDGNFRIITQNYYPERFSSLYILDENLEMKGSLTGLGKTEDFKSSRFIGHKLFLVTFQVIDPLFVIDVADPSDPTILGELKMPGYSTYLHPYDDNHLIGLGYHTEETEWGGVRNDGLKVDLYEVNYDKKCGDTDLTVAEQEKCDSGDYKGIIVKQKFSKTLGQNGSYSEALNNPRMFIWNANKELLFLPVQLYKNEDPDNTYKRTDFFQGLSVLNINKDSGINETARITHIDTAGIEEERAKECSKYSSQPDEPECKELIGGGEYCGISSRSTYVPTYCYADASISEYLASKSWNYRTSFVNRALYIGDSILSFSDEQLQSHDMNSYEKIGSVTMK